MAAMGAAMVTLIAHAHDGRTPAATAWVLCAGTAIVLCATMLVAASLQAWRDDRRVYPPPGQPFVRPGPPCPPPGGGPPAPPPPWRGLLPPPPRPPVFAGRAPFPP